MQMERANVNIEGERTIMIVVSGEFEIAEQEFETIREASIKMMRETAKEDGCIIYRLSRDIEFPGKIRIYEEWESEEALKAHFATPHMKEFQAARGKVKIISRELKKFEGINPTPL
jgi:quinol monooxygenase YgiN